MELLNLTAHIETATALDLPLPEIFIPYFYNKYGLDALDSYLEEMRQRSERSLAERY